MLIHFTNQLNNTQVHSKCLHPCGPALRHSHKTTKQPTASPLQTLGGDEGTRSPKEGTQVQAQTKTCVFLGVSGSLVPGPWALGPEAQDEVTSLETSEQRER